MSNQPAQLQLQKIYLKDASLETPMGIRAFQQNGKPMLNQQLQTRYQKMEDGLFEVILTATISAAAGTKENSQTLFIVEVQQGGLFRLQAPSAETEKQVVHTVCTGILFPYVREAVDSLVVKAGFPALQIPPVNFEALYQQAMQQNLVPAH